MALSSGTPFPTTPTFTISPFWENTTITPGPYCSIPALSLDTTRIASLTALSELDCGQCISICALTPTAIYECARVLLTDTNTLNPSPVLEIGPFMFSELVIEVVDDTDDDPDVDHGGEGDSRWRFVEGTEVVVEMEEQDLCKGVWDGEVLSTGEEPKGLLKGYMEEDYDWGRRVRRRGVKKGGQGAGEGKWKVGPWWGHAANNAADTGKPESGKWKVGHWWDILRR